MLNYLPLLEVIFLIVCVVYIIKTISMQEASRSLLLQPVAVVLAAISVATVTIHLILDSILYASAVPVMAIIAALYVKRTSVLAFLRKLTPVLKPLALITVILVVCGTVAALLFGVYVYWTWEWWDDFFKDHTILASVAKVAILALAVLLLFMLLDFWKQKRGQSGTQSKPSEPGKKVPYQDRDWSNLPWFMVPPAYAGDVLILGKEWRSGGPGFHLKLPFSLETIIFIDQQRKPAKFETDSVPTAGIREIHRFREISATMDTLPEEEKNADKSIGAQGSYKVQFNWRINDPLKILQYDASLRSGNEVEQFFASKLNSILRTTINRIPLEACFHLPAVIVALGNSEEIIGDLSKGEQADRWDHLLTDPRFRVNMDDQEAVRAVALEAPTSFIRQMNLIGFDILSFTIRDFNPEKGVQFLLDQRTAAKLKRQVNQTTIRQTIDTAEGERSVREIQTIGSARTISVLLKTLKDDLKEHFNLDFMPSQDQVMQLIPLLEHYRTIRLSREGQHFLIDFARFVPDLGKLLSGLKDSTGK